MNAKVNSLFHLKIMMCTCYVCKRKGIFVNVFVPQNID